MNISVLTELIDNQPEILEESAKNNNDKILAVIGIAKKVNEEGFSSLKGYQIAIFNKSIRPLIESVQCSGYTFKDDFPPSCDSILKDEDDILEYYQDQCKYCPSCQSLWDFEENNRQK
jgi:hypothetical protein